MLQPMRYKIYSFLVNRHAGIRQRYHKVHDDAIGIKKVLSWLYLFWLNFCYYILFCRFLGKQQEVAICEEKPLLIHKSESEAAMEELMSTEECFDRLCRYDVISFDIFDTLLFRPFSEPTDLFFFVGEKLGFLDFKRIRMEMEHKARELCRNKNGHSEVTLAEIWALMEKETGIPAETGMKFEMEAEEQFCYANPYMKEVFSRIQQSGKKIIIISDMYLPESFLKKLLEKNGFTGINHIYVSCECGKNKASGELYELVKQDFHDKARIIHTGDNMHSDIQMAKKHGIMANYYPNVNKNTRLYRAYDMSPVVGGAYRGIVNQHLYQGLCAYSMEYEYGFIYGGLFVLGYCNFIHQFCQHEHIEKILFLSRDGDILKQAYDFLFPKDCTEYVYWSRAAATKLMADHNRYDYFRRYLFHKVNQQKRIEDILEAMDLSFMLDGLPEELSGNDKLTEKNVYILKEYLESRWEQILASYKENKKAAQIYFSSILSGVKKACAVDIGWAGSGAVSLQELVKNEWKFSCEIVGIVAGTNTIHNAEPDTSEMHLQTGKLVSYLFSQSMNRDLMKRHDPNKDFNIYWELLLSSQTRQFRGFAFDKEKNQVDLCFGDADANQKGIREIQKGILAFVKEYQKHFEKFPYMQNISGRDAYAPMLLASDRDAEYLKEIKQQFDLKVAVE